MNIVETIPYIDTSFLPKVCAGCAADPLPGRELCKRCMDKANDRASRRAAKAAAERVRQKRRAAEGKVFVYAMGHPKKGPIKIGMSIDVKERHKAIAAMSPLPIEVFGYVESDSLLERRLHEALADHRSHGEWFERAPEVLEVVELLREGDVFELEFRHLD